MRAEGYAVESICAVLREQGVQVAARTSNGELAPGQTISLSLDKPINKPET